jgi:hypothetical protein
LDLHSAYGKFGFRITSVLDRETSLLDSSQILLFLSQRGPASSDHFSTGGAEIVTAAYQTLQQAGQEGVPQLTLVLEDEVSII